jgi:hypothetical protein
MLESVTGVRNPRLQLRPAPAWVHGYKMLSAD